MRRLFGVALVVFTIGAGTHRAAATEEACFTCDDVYFGGSDEWWHTDYDVGSQKKGTFHGILSPFSCGSHLNYAFNPP